MTCNIRFLLGELELSYILIRENCEAMYIFVCKINSNNENEGKWNNNLNKNKRRSGIKSIHSVTKYEKTKYIKHRLNKLCCGLTAKVMMV